MTQISIRPYKVEISPDEVKSMLDRVRNARSPPTDIVPGLSEEDDWGYGPPLRWMKKMQKYWSEEWDWGTWQKRLNEHDSFMATFEDESDGQGGRMEVFFVHAKAPRASGKEVIPMLLAHGWPGSFAEGQYIIDPLTKPDGDKQAFDVVVPSMPGYPFSSRPPRGWRLKDTARLFNKLMIQLGYDRYLAQGGDWGSIIARILGSIHQENCKAVHLNFCPAVPPFPYNIMPLNRPTVEKYGWLMANGKELNWIKKSMVYITEHFGYYAMQSTKPATVGFGLYDSPIAALAWIGEKIHIWADDSSSAPHRSSGKSPLNKDSLLTFVALHWLTGTIHTAMLPYKENESFTDLLMAKEHRLPNFGMSVFPEELAISPKWIVAKTGNLKFWKENTYGGHFAAFEVPDLMAENIREAVAVLW